MKVWGLDGHFSRLWSLRRSLLEVMVLWGVLMIRNGFLRYPRSSLEKLRYAQLSAKDPPNQSTDYGPFWVLITLNPKP